MGVSGIMHAKSDSEVTSCCIDASPPRSPPRRPLYYVQSPSHSQQQDVLDKMSYGSSPIASPNHYHFHHYHCSPIHHSRESSTSRFSDSLKNPDPPGIPNLSGWKRLQKTHHQVYEEDDDDVDAASAAAGYGKSAHLKFYVVCFLFFFVVLFTIFSLILWASSIPYPPKIYVKNIVFENFNVQAGMDNTGVPTDMLTMNSTVKIFYRNPATFFGVHVTSTPLQFHYFDLKLASGQMKKFYQSRKSQRTVVVVVQGHQVPLYGGVPVLSGSRSHHDGVSVPVNLTFVMRSRAYILGRLVKPKFYSNILCEVTLRSAHLGKPINLTNHASCVYQ